MTVTRLEDLPNELWLEFFVYFTWFELDSAWLQWKLNNRIQLLVEIAQNRVAVPLSSLSFLTYGEWMHYFEHTHPKIAHRITCLVLNESVISSEIINRWLENEKCFLPRLRKCIVYIDLLNRCARMKIILLIRRHALTLHHIVFYFNRTDLYYDIMRVVIKERISLHTMEFILIEDSRYYEWRSSLAEYIIDRNEILTFPNTVRLRLSLQHMSDFALLMQSNTSSHIEDLHVTMETGIYTSYQLDNYYDNLSDSILCSNNFNNLANLRRLQLRQVAIHNVIVLIEHVKSMCRLESLILVNCYVKNKNELLVFKSYTRNVLICLRCLRFLLYLPAETKLEKLDLDWFDLSHSTVEYEINEFMVLYTIPYPLNSQRQVHNHTFGRKSTINTNIHHIQWIIDRDPLSIDTTLTHFRYVNSLVLFVDIDVNLQYKSLNEHMDCWRVFLPSLRHLQIHFDWNPTKSGIPYYQPVTLNHYRCFILEQFRKCAPALESLTLHWPDIALLLEHSSSQWSSVRQLHIRLLCPNLPCASFIQRLPTNEAFPQLQYVSFNRCRFSLNPSKLLAPQILSCFDALVSSSSKFIILHVNRCCVTYRSHPPTSRDILLSILTEHIGSKDDHCSSSKIVIDDKEEIIIWL